MTIVESLVQRQTEEVQESSGNLEAASSSVPESLQAARKLEAMRLSHGVGCIYELMDGIDDENESWSEDD